MRLLHLTDSADAYVAGSDRDKEVCFTAVWTQAVHGDDEPCCPGFGRSSVRVFPWHLTPNWEEDGDVYWNLFYISCTQGRKAHHFFYKYVFVPADMPGYGKKSCKRRGWSFIGSVLPRPSFDWNQQRPHDCNLRQLISPHFDLDDGDINHVHIGIMLEGLHDFRCWYCRRSFRSEDALSQHQDATGHFSCLCGAHFQSSTALYQHQEDKGHWAE